MSPMTTLYNVENSLPVKRQRLEVSVLLTVYNRQQFIAEAIEAVLGQTWRDFELIVVDDCSTDDSVSIAESYLHDERVRVVSNPQNLGQFANRNFAASLARGKYLKYADSDDILYRHCLGVMLETMHAFPEAAIGISTRGVFSRPFPILLDPSSAYREHFFGQPIFAAAPNSTIILKEAFDACGGFQPLGAASADTLSLLRIASAYSVVLMPSGLSWYRVHPGQVNPSTGRLMLESALEIPLIFSSVSVPLPSHQQVRIANGVIGVFCRYCIRLALSARIVEAWRLLKEFGRRPTLRQALTRSPTAHGSPPGI